MLELLKIEDFDKVYKIMQDSFPEDEYRPYHLQKELLNDSHYEIYTLSDEDKNIMAFMCVWKFDAFDYFEHFAVSSKYRNKGLGTKMLNELKDILSNRIVLEVELPDSDIAKRRIAFYQRNGFYYNDYHYIQPPMSEGKNTVPLRIMTLNQKITKDEFEHIKNTLYKHVYKAI